MTATAKGSDRELRDVDPAVDDLDASEDLDDLEDDLSTEAPTRAWGLLLIITSALGFLASMVLTIDRITIAGNPDATFACDISPFVACGPAMTSEAGAIFGFPNPLLGIAGYAITGTTGVLLASGLRPPRWYLLSLQAGVIGAAVLITFLQYQIINVVNALCLWCFLVWLVTIPIVVTTTITNLRVGTFGAGLQRIGRELAHWQVLVVTIWYVALLVALGLRFYAEFARYWFGVSL
ncbi:vitamin K epoxide reductase family protein [Desertihabitans aurantiacus]|uniref:vitamin K epoxide reductase family protein n=1 Tax=Desertihabitans aurantiacus TaxID=2282477 RepID=UPI001300B55F|nr:vitamin K epoxide reductase family protein [Desertihabitans aurantiacus]